MPRLLALAAAVAATVWFAAPAQAQRTTCAYDDVTGRSCIDDLHQRPLEFWQQYQEEAPALREGFLKCWDLRNDFGDWVRAKREDLWNKSRSSNHTNGYLPMSVVQQSDWSIQQMALSFEGVEYNQIINAGARPELCQERILYWKKQILAITEKFPPLKPARNPYYPW